MKRKKTRRRMESGFSCKSGGWYGSLRQGGYAKQIGAFLIGLGIGTAFFMGLEYQNEAWYAINFGGARS